MPNVVTIIEIAIFDNLTFGMQTRMNPRIAKPAKNFVDLVLSKIKDALAENPPQRRSRTLTIDRG
jgi:hypothetical protein